MTNPLTRFVFTAASPIKKFGVAENTSRKQRRFDLCASLVLFTLSPLTAQGALVLDLTDGGGSLVDFSFSGSDTINAGFSVGTATSGRLRLPEDNGWSSFFTAGSFDDSGSELLGVTNITSGIFSATGDPSVYIDGSEVALSGGGLAGDGDWEVFFSGDPSFRFQVTSGADV